MFESQRFDDAVTKVMEALTHGMDKMQVPMTQTGPHPKWVVEQFMQSRMAYIECQHGLAVLSSVIRAMLSNLDDETKKVVEQAAIDDLNTKAQVIVENRPEKSPIVQAKTMPDWKSSRIVNPSGD